MRPIDSIRIVAAREVTQRLRSRSFQIFTALLCLGIIAAGVIHSLVGSEKVTRFEVALVGPAPVGFSDAMQTFARTLDIEVNLSELGTRQDMTEALTDGRIDVAIDTETETLRSKSNVNEALAAVVNAAWQNSQAQIAAQNLGLSAQDSAAILQPRGLSMVRLSDEAKKANGVGTAVGTLSAMLLFISISFFGSYVLIGVVEEKTTGVVEVLLSQVRARHLLAGKVLGMGVVAMVQFAAAVVAGMVALRISGVSVPSSVWVGLPATVLWFVGGYLLYSTLFALAGSFVSRQEDAQGASAPITMVFTIAYFAVFTLGTQPSSVATRIVSLLPPFSPMLMPLRMATGSASVREILLAAVLLIVGVLAMLRLAGSIYSRTLLHRGQRLRWRQALRKPHAVPTQSTSA